MVVVVDVVVVVVVVDVVVDVDVVVVVLNWEFKEIAFYAVNEIFEFAEVDMQYSDYTSK